MRIINVIGLLACLGAVSSCKKPSLDSVRNTSDEKQVKPMSSFFSGTFTHPGIMNNQRDIDRIKSKYLTTEPWKSAFTAFSANAYSSANYPVKINDTVTCVIRDVGGVDIANFTKFRQDCNGAYQNALMYVITNNLAHATKAKTILNKWASQLQRIYGYDAKLAAALGGFKLACAAELIRYSPVSLTSTEITNIENMFKSVFYPVTQSYYPTANGNWDAAMIKAHMAYGVFCNDATIFNNAVNQFYNKNTSTNGSLDKYILSTTGQCQESGRDQSHSQLGLGHLAEASQVGANQGLDMFSSLNNRLLLGYEYTAKYNLGYTVPFQPYYKVDGNLSEGTVISTTDRGVWVPVYELVYNHYANRAGMPAASYQYTKQVADQLRPEGEAHFIDQVGWGTLLYTIEPSSTNLLSNNDFTNGTTNWTNEGYATLTPYVDAGEPVIKVESRTFDYGGPRQNVKNALVANGQGTYDVSAMLKKITATTTPLVGAVTIKLNYNGGAYYTRVKENYTNGWTQISGSVNLQWTGTLTNAEFYVETPGNTWGIEVDKCSLVKVK
ncbi:alginate lyase family protein [Mucilaginibacter sp. PAMB04274]|uniref:alginate lyase family protein n=1 Tax=Mucilaginibacter sp. PAMB04274 TaxID=3138568 RepID=UPI0031F6D6D4